ncbi:MAG: Coenzyme F420 hydrogenase/dehydrogenase, beta subunit C-terminal domain [Bacteroidales bacterium]|nr:Coenzyme F420 hydrogenase/dehydrogenase, beta subunit C-terminal domain [Bacteroidales bacterium]
MNSLLCERDKCTGCLACYNVCRHSAIQVASDDEGFLRPVINSSLCVGCHLCQKVCPVLQGATRINAPAQAYAAWAKDKSIHRKSSSGGVFSVIAIEVLKQKGVVFGAAFDKEWNVGHCCAEDLKQLEALRGSKYLQSNIGLTYRDVEDKLKAGKIVLFVGTPCQVEGLNHYISMRQVADVRLITIDLACHGVPTAKVFKDYIGYLEKCKGRKIRSFSFRDKHWSWNRYNTKAVFSGGDTYLGKWEEDCYMRGFLRDIFLRPSCHGCIYANAIRQGDITLSDYWNYSPQAGEIVDHDYGVSVVLVNSEKGRHWIDVVKEAMVIYPREIENALKSSPPYQYPFPESPERMSFWEDYNKNGFNYLIGKYFYPEEIKPRYLQIYKYGRIPYRTIEEYKRIMDLMKRSVQKFRARLAFRTRLKRFLNSF